MVKSINIASLMLPYLEPFLNTVMRQAQAKLGPGHPLNADISLDQVSEANLRPRIEVERPPGDPR